MTSTPSRVCEALDRMIESVLADLKEQDPGNHATIGSLQGELKGLQAARRLASMQSEIEPKNAAAQVSGMATPGTVAEADRSELTAVGTASHPATGAVGVLCDERGCYACVRCIVR